MLEQSDFDYILEKCRNGDRFDGDRGYVLEVDMEIPDSIYDKLDDLPVAPESACPPGSKVKNLLLTHNQNQTMLYIVGFFNSICV